MKNLFKRQIQLIRLLLDEKEYKPIQYYAKKLEVSDKTLQEDLKVIRAALKQYGTKILAKTGQGIILDGASRCNMELLNQLHAGSQNQKWGTQERRNNILKNLLLQSGTATSMQKLSDHYYVGKASIVNDLKYIEEWIAQFHLSLEKTKKGTLIVGREKDIREAIIRIIHLDEVTLNNLLEIFQPADIAFVEAMLEELELEEETDTSDIYYKNLMTHILICIQRVRDGKKVSAPLQNKDIHPRNKRQYQSACNISQRIKERYAIDIGKDEIFYIYQYISSLETVEKTGVWIREPGDRSCEIAAVMTEYMADILGVEFCNEEVLLQGLMMHIRPLLNRLEYNIKIANPLLLEMQNSYPQMVGICQIVWGIIREKYSLKDISLDEIANIATYYQTMMVRQTAPIKVLVVCHSGYGTAQLLSARLQQEFSGFQILDVIPSRKLSTVATRTADFIISTVPIEPMEIPHLVVSSLLANQDISAIRNTVYLIEQKEDQQYFRLKTLLKGEHILFDHWKGFKARGQKICEAYLLPQCVVILWKDGGESTKAFLTVDMAENMLRLDIIPESEKHQEELLCEIYRFSLEEEKVKALLECKTKKAVVKYLHQEGK